MKLGIEDVHFVTQPQPSLPSLWTQVIDHLTTLAGTDRLGTRDASVTNLLTPELALGVPTSALIGRRA